MTKLYVANVPFRASEEELRAHFSACGQVHDVEIFVDDRTGRSKGQGCVTMASDSDARAALEALDGKPFEGRTLRVSETPLGGTGDEAPKSKVRITQQYRERAKMAYELDCNGMPVTLRVFAGEGQDWGMEVRSPEASGGVVATGTGRTRHEALADVVRRWNEAAATASIRPLDGDGLLAALKDVKAV